MKTNRLTLPLAALLACLVPVAASFAEGAKPGKPRAIDTIKYPKLHDIKMPNVVRETLPNGMKLILVEDHDLPQISLRATVRGGKLAEPAAKRGLTELLGEGATPERPEAVSDALEGGEVEEPVRARRGWARAACLVRRTRTCRRERPP